MRIYVTLRPRLNMLNFHPSGRLLSALALAAALNVPWASAADFKFTGEDGGSFLEPGNWSPDGPPGINDAAVLDEAHSATLSEPAEVARLALGNDAGLVVESGGHLEVGKANLYVGFSGFNGVSGAGTALLELKDGGRIAVSKFYIASSNPNGRGATVKFSGGAVVAPDRFWVGAEAINQAVVGELTIEGSGLAWETPTADVNLGSVGGKAIINFVFDASGISKIEAVNVRLGGQNVTLRVNAESLAPTDNATYPLITYSGKLTGEFGDVFVEGLPDGFTGTIDYGSGEDGAVSLQVEMR